MPGLKSTARSAAQFAPFLSYFGNLDDKASNEVLASLLGLSEYCA